MINQKLKIIDEATYGEYIRDYHSLTLTLEDIQISSRFQLHEKEWDWEDVNRLEPHKNIILSETDNVRKIHAKANVRDNIYIASKADEDSKYVVLKKDYESIRVNIEAGKPTSSGIYIGQCVPCDFDNNTHLVFDMVINQEKFDVILNEIINDVNNKTIELHILLSCFIYKHEQFDTPWYPIDKIIEPRTFFVLKYFHAYSENEHEEVDENEYEEVDENEYEEESVKSREQISQEKTHLELQSINSTLNNANSFALAIVLLLFFIWISS